MASEYSVKVLDTDEQMLKQLANISQIEGTPEKQEKVREYLRSLAV
jgi:flagellar hook assembly protein FlgD